MAWIRNFTYCFMWHKIRYPCQNFDGAHVESLSRICYCQRVTMNYHLNENVVILTKFLSLAVPEVVKMTTSGTVSDKNFVKMTTLSSASGEKNHQTFGTVSVIDATYPGTLYAVDESIQLVHHSVIQKASLYHDVTMDLRHYLHSQFPSNRINK